MTISEVVVSETDKHKPLPHIPISTHGITNMMWKDATHISASSNTTWNDEQKHKSLLHQNANIIFIACSNSDYLGLKLCRFHLLYENSTLS